MGKGGGSTSSVTDDISMLEMRFSMRAPTSPATSLGLLPLGESITSCALAAPRPVPEIRLVRAMMSFCCGHEVTEIHEAGAETQNLTAPNPHRNSPTPCATVLKMFREDSHSQPD